MSANSMFADSLMGKGRNLGGIMSKLNVCRCVFLSFLKQVGIIIICFYYL